MMKTLTAGVAATALVAAVITAPTKAEAYPVWVIPAIIAAGVGGGAVGGAATASARPYAYEPAGTVYARPSVEPSTCHIVRERTASGWRRVQVCD
jgi:hypothetical protein